MPQIRDAQTSELIAEGTPLEIATCADSFAPGEILFDDAGAVDDEGRSRFSPSAIRSFRAQEIDALQAQLTALEADTSPDPDGDRDRQRRRLREALRERRDRITAGRAMAVAAQDRQMAARNRVQQRGQG